MIMIFTKFPNLCNIACSSKKLLLTVSVSLGRENPYLLTAGNRDWGSERESRAKHSVRPFAVCKQEKHSQKNFMKMDQKFSQIIVPLRSAGSIWKRNMKWWYILWIQFNSVIAGLPCIHAFCIHVAIINIHIKGRLEKQTGKHAQKHC